MAKRKTKPAATRPLARTPYDENPRCAIACEVTWQIAGIFDALIELGVELDGPDTLQEAAIIRALAIRGRDLNQAGMAMLGDSQASISKARAIVIGKDLKAEYAGVDLEEIESEFKEASHG